MEPCLDPPQETLNVERSSCPAKTLTLVKEGVWVESKEGRNYLIPLENVRHIEFGAPKEIEIDAELPPLKKAA